MIRQMSHENVLWGAPRIQGELLKLGFAVAQSTVAKYMVERNKPSGQSWHTGAEKGQFGRFFDMAQRRHPSLGPNALSLDHAVVGLPAR